MIKKKHLLLFSTEGPPHDNGLDLSSQSDFLIDFASRSFSDIFHSTPRDLISRNLTWEETLQDRTSEITSDPRFSSAQKWNQNWAKLGFQQWKPRLLLETLEDERISKGEILLYHDTNYSKYPEYLEGIKNSPKWLDLALFGHDVLLFRDNRARITSDVKQELLDQFLPGSDWSKLKHIWAGAIALRKNSESVEFLKNWMRACEVFENVSPMSSYPDNPSFVGHSLEQAVLSVLWHSEYWNNNRFRLIDLKNSREIRFPVRSSFRRKR